MSSFSFWNSDKRNSNGNGNGRSKNQNKNKRPNHNHHQENENYSCINNNNSDSNNKHQKLEQMQLYKQGQNQSQEKIVLHTQIVLDQLQNCFEMFASFGPAVMTKMNKKGKKIGSAEMQARNSLVVGSVNIFGSMCVDLQDYKNKRALDIASQQLYTYVQGLGKPEYDILKPFLQYMNCAANGVKVPVLPAIEVDAKQWNSKNVNSMLSGLLGSGHVIGEKHDEYRKKIQQLDEQLEQVWRRNGKKSANICSGNGNGNSIHLPDANSMYRHSGPNIKLSHGFKNNQYANAPLKVQLECQGDYDYEQQHQGKLNDALAVPIEESTDVVMVINDNQHVASNVSSDDARLVDWLVSKGFKKKKLQRVLSDMGINDFDELNDRFIEIFHGNEKVRQMGINLLQRGIERPQMIAFLKATEILVKKPQQPQKQRRGNRNHQNYEN